MDPNTSGDATIGLQDSQPAKKRRLESLGNEVLEIFNDDEEDSFSTEFPEKKNSESESFLKCSPSCSDSRPKTAPASDVSKMKVVKVLQNDSYSIKILAVQNGIPGRFLVHMKKIPFDEKNVEEIIAGVTNISQVIDNDAYGSFTAAIPSALNRVHISVEYSATNRQFPILTNDWGVVEETAENYETISKPFIENGKLKRKQWIYNILNGVSEVDRVILRDANPETGFVVLPDFKWTGEQLSDLYCLAIVNRRDLASIRDLTGDCLPLLRKIRDEATRTICSKYGVAPGRLSAYLHYLPSFYHLHVHFRQITFCDEGPQFGRIHPLATVISNLEMDPLYYRKCTLSVVVRHNPFHPLRKLVNINNSQPGSVSRKRKRIVKVNNNQKDGINAMQSLPLFSASTSKPRIENTSESSGKSIQMSSGSTNPKIPKWVTVGEPCGSKEYPWQLPSRKDLKDADTNEKVVDPHLEENIHRFSLTSTFTNRVKQIVQSMTLPELNDVINLKRAKNMMRRIAQRKAKKAKAKQNTLNT